MRIYLLLIFALFVFLFSCRQESENLPSDSEEFHKIEIQKKIGGRLEYPVKNGRVDLLTDEIAYEVAWANDWKESIGKAIWYGVQTHRDAGIILIIEKESDVKYVHQLKSTIEYINSNKEIHVMLYPKDFE